MSYSVLIGVLIVVGLLLCWLSVRQIKKRHPIRAGAEGLGGLLLLALAGLGAALIVNLHTYQRLTYEQPVAEILIQQLQPDTQQYQVELRYFAADGQLISRQFPMTGDEWLLDARVLKWSSPATLFGLDANYRLERLSSRYRNLQQAQTTLPTIHGLAEQEAHFDLWALRQDYPDWLPFLDTTYGSGVYMPLANNAEYAISISQSGGLLARPGNPAAQSAIQRW